MNLGARIKIAEGNVHGLDVRDVRSVLVHIGVREMDRSDAIGLDADTARIVYKFKYR